MVARQNVRSGSVAKRAVVWGVGWECDRAEHCEPLATLKSVNGNLNIDNLRRIKTIGISAFLSESAKQEGLSFYTDPTCPG